MRRLARALVQALGSSTFRPYHTTDVRGVEIGGAAKNVLAIAAGIVAGRKLGACAPAALTTRGFSELARFGRACGARSETLTGLSGLGDLILTCSARSRAILRSASRSGAASGRAGKLAEGEFTAPVLIELAASQNVDMPDPKAVAAMIDGAINDRCGDRGSADTAVQGGGAPMQPRFEESRQVPVHDPIEGRFAAASGCRARALLLFQPQAPR